MSNSISIKRDDPIYLEIEHFKDFELTNNIAFEMAIRNEENQKLIREYIEIQNIINEDDLTYILYLSDEDSVIKSSWHTITDLLFEKGFSKHLEGLFDDENIVALIEQKVGVKLNCHPSKRNKFSPSLGIKKSRVDGKFVRFWSALDSGENAYRIDNDATDEDLDMLINGSKSIRSNISNLRFLLEEKRHIPESLLKILDDLPENDLIIPYKRYMRGSFHRKDEADIVAEIIMSRPMILPTATAKNVTISLNMALPLEELQAQIEIIKKEFDDNFHSIKSAAEHFNFELHKSDDKMPKNRTSKMQKIADWFFAYDCYKILKKDSDKSDEIVFGEIDLILMEYYGVTKDFYYSTETYKKTILKKMKYYIDEEGYKELLTNSSEG